MRLIALAASALLWLGYSAAAEAAQPSSGGASQGSGQGSKGASASGSVGTSGAKGSSSSSGYEWPDFVYGGNAIQVMLPFQIGIVGYEPRVRIGLQYDRQLYKRHWFHIGAASLLDRGDHKTFGENPCGREMVTGDKICEPGTVAGFDGYVGYTYKFYVEKRPYVVPLLRAGVGGGFWKYPSVSKEFQHQDRDLTWTLSGRLGSGARLFLTRDLAVGFDVNFSVGFARHRDAPLNVDHEWISDFLLGIEILPAAEYRF